MRKTVLIVEDDEDIRDLIRYHLVRDGFVVLSASNGRQGLKIARTDRPDLIVLDLMMPELTGLEFCRLLRADRDCSGIPVLMLTAKTHEDDRIKGFELGADDYVTKPFSPKEVLLRIHALLRRSTASDPTDVLRYGNVEVDHRNYEIRLNGLRMDLTQTEHKLLALLMDRRGKVQSRSTLLHDVWGHHPHMDTRTVDTHVRRLRDKLGPDAFRIETIRGEGYRFSTADSLGAGSHAP